MFIKGNNIGTCNEMNSRLGLRFWPVKQKNMLLVDLIIDHVVPYISLPCVTEVYLWFRHKNSRNGGDFELLLLIVAIRVKNDAEKNQSSQNIMITLEKVFSVSSRSSKSRITFRFYEPNQTTSVALTLTKRRKMAKSQKLTLNKIKTLEPLGSV